MKVKIIISLLLVFNILLSIKTIKLSNELNYIKSMYNISIQQLETIKANKGKNLDEMVNPISEKTIFLTGLFSNDSIRKVSIDSLISEPEKSIFIYYPQGGCSSCLHEILLVLNKSMNPRQEVYILSKNKIDLLSYRIRNEQVSSVIIDEHGSFLNDDGKIIIFSLANDYSIQDSFVADEDNVSSIVSVLLSNMKPSL